MQAASRAYPSEFQANKRLCSLPGKGRWHLRNYTKNCHLKSTHAHLCTHTYIKTQGPRQTKKRKREGGWILTLSIQGLLCLHSVCLLCSDNFLRVSRLGQEPRQRFKNQDKVFKGNETMAAPHLRTCTRTCTRAHTHARMRSKDNGWLSFSSLGTSAALRLEDKSNFISWLPFLYFCGTGDNHQGCTCAVNMCLPRH